MAPLVFITVDTEEDEWGAYTRRQPGVSNIAQLSLFQELCERYGAIPTYLSNWPVIAEDASRDVLRDIASAHAEIGTHIHPWNTPPVAEEVGARASMLCNLPAELIAQKLENLHRAMQDRLSLAPTTFRAGRWAFGADVAQVLEQLAYRVDSSVSPYVNWAADHGPDYRRAPARAYRFAPHAPLVSDGAGSMLEVPMSIGFLGGNPVSGQQLREWAFRPLPRRLRMVGLLDRLRLASLRWLSPEVSTADEMVRLSRVLIAAGASYLNFTFHSPTLTPGLTPFVRSREECNVFLRRIESFLEFARGSGYRFAPLSQAEMLRAG